VPHAQEASQPQGDMAGRIFQALQQVKMPVALESLGHNIRRAVKEHAGCGNVWFWRDENPRIEVEEYLSSDIKHVVEHHVDTLVCDGREFEVEALYELYEVGGYSCYYIYDIAHSFKPIRVQERKEPKLLKPEELTPAESLKLILSTLLGFPLPDEVFSEAEKKQPQAQEAKTQDN